MKNGIKNETKFDKKLNLLSKIIRAKIFFVNRYGKKYWVKFQIEFNLLNLNFSGKSNK